jgi:hypothetical protein
MHGHWILISCCCQSLGSVKNTHNPKVNLDMSGDFGFRIFRNPQAKIWFLDAIEASLLGKTRSALIRPYGQQCKQVKLLVRHFIKAFQTIRISFIMTI